MHPSRVANVFSLFVGGEEKKVKWHRHQERQDDGGSGYVLGYRSGQDVDADTQGGPDAQGDEVEGGETFVQLGRLLGPML